MNAKPFGAVSHNKVAESGALKRLAQANSLTGSWLVAAIEGVQETSGTGRDDPGWFHPSAFGSDCDAQLAFRFLGAPAVQFVAARSQRIFDLGHGRDEYLKNDVQRAGISLCKTDEDRRIVIPQLYIRGDLDEWVQNPVTKRKYVVDFKTMHLRDFTELKEAKHSHHLQLLCYEFAKETYEGLVLYECKNDQEFKCMQADFDNKMWQEEIVDRICRIITSLNANRVDRNPVSCGRCPFFNNGVCASNEIAKLKEESGLFV